MRAQKIGTVAASFVLLLSLQGCGSNDDAEGLFTSSSGGAAVDASTDTGAGGASGSGGTQAEGGTGGTAEGGTGGGSGGTGGVGGTSGTGGIGGMGGGGPGGTGGGPGGTGGAAGTGGPPQPPGEIPCSGDFFDPEECSVPGEVCCLSFGNPYSGDCVPTSEAPSCETVVTCAGPVDCPPGTECCGTLIQVGPTNRYGRVSCRPSCDGPDDVVFCDPYDEFQTCPYGTSCEDSQILPDGYYVCQS